MRIRTACSCFRSRARSRTRYRSSRRQSSSGNRRRGSAPAPRVAYVARVRVVVFVPPPIEQLPVSRHRDVGDEHHHLSRPNQVLQQRLVVDSRRLKPKDDVLELVLHRRSRRGPGMSSKSASIVSEHEPLSQRLSCGRAVEGMVLVLRDVDPDDQVLLKSRGSPIVKTKQLLPIDSPRS